MIAMDFDKRENAAQVSGGVFLIGLGLLFLTGWWWPGIMFVSAASIMARTMAEGKPLSHATGAFWLIGIGVLFGMPGLIGDIANSFWKFFPLILIGLGLFMFFGGRYRPSVDSHEDKRKNDDDDVYQV
jgi:hypothetical protein